MLLDTVTCFHYNFYYLAIFWGGEYTVQVPKYDAHPSEVLFSVVVTLWLVIIAHKTQLVDLKFYIEALKIKGKCPTLCVQKEKNFCFEISFSGGIVAVFVLLLSFYIKSDCVCMHACALNMSWWRHTHVYIRNCRYCCCMTANTSLQKA